MSVRSNATAVGAFVLGAIAIAIGIAVVFGSGLLFKRRHALRHLLRRLARGARGRCSGQVSRRPDRPGGLDLAVFRDSRKAVDIPVVIELRKVRFRRQKRRGHDGGPDREGPACAARAGEPDHRPALCRARHLSRHADPRGPATSPTILRSRRYPRCRPDLQQTLSELIADRPKPAERPRADARAVQRHDRRRRCPGPGQAACGRWRGSPTPGRPEGAA